MYLLHPPGGVVSGDELQLSVEVRPKAHALLTTPAAGKFYAGAADRRRAARRGPVQTLAVNDGVLEWLPQENIFYPDGAATLRTRVELATARALSAGRSAAWDCRRAVHPLGPARYESFELWRGAAPLLLDRLNHRGQRSWRTLGSGRPRALGTWLAFSGRRHDCWHWRTRLRAMNCADLTLACTLVDGALCCRGLAARADRLKQAFIDLWSALRPPSGPRVAIAAAHLGDLEG